MPSDNSYPRNTVWYIEACSDRTASANRSSGSAVSVWLDDLNSSSKRRKYLLTCCHCVRAGVGLKNEPIGSLLREVLCWPHNAGYSIIRSESDWDAVSINREAWQANVVDLYQRSEDSITREALRTSQDWVLLDVEDESFQEYPAVHCWKTTINESVCIIGYPGGNTEWHGTTVVENQIVRGFTMQVLPNSPAETTLTGGPTAAGMSGGAILNDRHEFCGLHRSASIHGITVRGVSAEHISQELQAHKFRVFQYELNQEVGEPSLPSKRRWILVGISILVAAAIAYWFWTSNSDVNPDWRAGVISNQEVDDVDIMRMSDYFEAISSESISERKLREGRTLVSAGKVIEKLSDSITVGLMDGERLSEKIYDNSILPSTVVLLLENTQGIDNGEIEYFAGTVTAIRKPIEDGISNYIVSVKDAELIESQDLRRKLRTRFQHN